MFSYVFCSRTDKNYFFSLVKFSKIKWYIGYSIIWVTIFQNAIFMRNAFEYILMKRPYIIKLKETLPCDGTYVSSKLCSRK